MRFDRNGGYFGASISSFFHAARCAKVARVFRPTLMNPILARCEGIRDRDKRHEREYIRYNHLLRVKRSFRDASPNVDVQAASVCA